MPNFDKIIKIKENQSFSLLNPEERAEKRKCNSCKLIKDNFNSSLISLETCIKQIKLAVDQNGIEDIATEIDLTQEELIEIYNEFKSVVEKFNTQKSFDDLV